MYQSTVDLITGQKKFDAFRNEVIEHMVDSNNYTEEEARTITGDGGIWENDLMYAWGEGQTALEFLNIK